MPLGMSIPFYVVITSVVNATYGKTKWLRTRYKKMGFNEQKEFAYTIVEQIHQVLGEQRNQC